jgi:hypothetical protein
MRILTETMKTIVSALRFGLLVMKIGLATQDAGAFVPNFEDLLAKAGDYLSAMKEAVAEHIENNCGDKLEAVDAYLARAVTLEAMNGAMRAIEPHIRKGEGVKADDKEWVSIMCGLNKVTSNTSDRAVAG